MTKRKKLLELQNLLTPAARRTLQVFVSGKLFIELPSRMDATIYANSETTAKELQKLILNS